MKSLFRGDRGRGRSASALDLRLSKRGTTADLTPLERLMRQPGFRQVFSLFSF